MLVLCAWCEREGIRNVLKEGDEHGPISHGICDRHQQDMLDEVVKVVESKRSSNPRRRRVWRRK